MLVYLALAGVAIIPFIVIALFPRQEKYLEHVAVRGFGLGVYTILIVILLRESVEIGGLLNAGGWFAVGLALSLLIGLAVKEFHHHHSSEERAHRHNKGSTWRVLISDFFHNIVDGIVIIAGFGVSTSIGFIAFAGVLGHQIIQQTGQQILLIESGIKPERAIFISLIVALSVFLGFGFQGQEALQMILLSLSAGIITWKVVKDILEVSWSKKMVMGFALGAFVLAAILLLVPHAHEEESTALTYNTEQHTEKNTGMI